MWDNLRNLERGGGNMSDTVPVVQVGNLKMPVRGRVDAVVESEVEQANRELKEEAAIPGKNKVQERVVKEMDRETSRRGRA